MKDLRSALLEIFGIDEEHLVPMSEGWFVPTFNKDDPKGTWIGYRILDKHPNMRGYEDNGYYVRPIQATFRLSFVGMNAEEYCDQTLLWEERTDVTKAFESRLIQINYNSRSVFSYPVSNGGFNDSLCWCADFACQGFYCQKVEHEYWNLKEVNLGGKIIHGGLNG